MYGYGYGMGYDPIYLVIMVIATILGAVTQGYIKSTYAKWSEVSASFGCTGAEVARRMLDSEGASDVGITRVAGTLTDYYDPRDNNLHLSDDNNRGGSVASVAVALHEAGHAVQAAKGYGPYKLRSALVPAVTFAQNAWVIMLIIGFALNLSGLVNLAIAVFAVAVLFQVVTLPVEFNASHRAVEYLRQRGTNIDEQGARKVLTAAALTYVAAALISIMQLFYYMARYSRRND